MTLRTSRSENPGGSFTHTKRGSIRAASPPSPEQSTTAIRGVQPARAVVILGPTAGHFPNESAGGVMEEEQLPESWSGFKRPHFEDHHNPSPIVPPDCRTAGKAGESGSGNDSSRRGGRTGTAWPPADMCACRKDLASWNLEARGAGVEPDSLPPGLAGVMRRSMPSHRPT